MDNSHSAVPALLKGKRLNYPILSMYIENNFASYFLLSDNGIITQFSKSFEKVSDLPEISMRIIEEIKNSENNAESIENIFIFGNNVSDELKSSLIEFLGIKVISLNPFTLLKIDEDLNENRFIHEFGYRFSPAVGIALRS